AVPSLKSIFIILSARGSVTHKVLPSHVRPSALLVGASTVNRIADEIYMVDYTNGEVIIIADSPGKYARGMAWRILMECRLSNRYGLSTRQRR
ncbi:hypothetical protein ACFLTH_18050, partial [Bacteroidota bacterium]